MILEDISRMKACILLCSASQGLQQVLYCNFQFEDLGVPGPMKGVMSMNQCKAWNENVCKQNQPMFGTCQFVVFLPGSTVYVHTNSWVLHQLMAILKCSIMPPGMAHNVFTPIVVMIGSHFLYNMPVAELSI